MPRRVTPLLLLALGMAGGLRAQAPAADPWAADLDAYIRHGTADWAIPGLAVAVVRNDSVVFLRGYGVRELGQPGAVGPHTLYGIMSTTKAMTAVALAQLVDDGTLAWDDPVTRWVPEFQMPEPYVTSSLRVIDLLTHNAGLGNADLLWTRGDVPRGEIFRRLRLLAPAYPLRGGFVYQNLMYGLAGEVIARASGMRYEEFLRRRLFNPLGMTRSYASLAAMRATADPDRSAPHYRIRDTIRVIGEDDVDVVGSAGAVWSTAADMATWVRFLLAGGRTAGGRQLLSERSFATLLAPHAIIPPEQYYPTAALTRPHWRTYGLGWFEQDYRGEFVAFHTGSLAGRTALVGLLPGRHTGVVVLGNLDHAEFRHALMLRVFDLAIGGPPRDWSRELLALYTARRGAPPDPAAGRVPDTRPSLPLAAYAGRYVHPLWGDIVITLAGEALTFRMGVSSELAGPMEHLHYDTFLARLGDGRDPPPRVVFGLGGDGTVAELQVPDYGLEGFRRDP
ncbi:MAG: serine hydrolase [Gemmatimonadetes bacterium]|nr:serine hydrolase [Gemmatimonadota bacterium]MBK7786167.1 serine hydrolase [Gemmatimonadota bacterium]